jgi:hypothetical protein
MYMYYFSGEQPTIGDRVSDKQRREGTIKHIVTRGPDMSLVIEWDDGILGVRNLAEDLVLVARSMKP